MYSVVTTSNLVQITETPNKPARCIVQKIAIDSSAQISDEAAENQILELKKDLKERRAICNRKQIPNA